jgi:hypothetical protein
MSELHRWRRLALALAPIWLSRYDRWQSRRQRERLRAQRIIERMAHPEMHEPPEREPRDVNSVFARMQQHRRPSWYAAADEMRRDRDALHARIGPRHGITRAADNLSRYR